MIASIKQAIYRPYAKYLVWRKYKSLKRHDDNTRRIYLLNVPSHGNLGDHLLSVAGQQFFKDKFPQYRLILVTSADLYYSIKYSLSSVREKDILCITGGGFLGSLYGEENRFLEILRRYPDNKILVLPQTIYYEDNAKGKRMLSQAVTTYQTHRNLYVTVRDQNSYDILRQSLMAGRETHIALTPDLALYLVYPSINNRDGILWCMRKDLEIRDSNAAIVLELKRQVSDTGLQVSTTDTYVNYPVPLSIEDTEVQKKLEQFSRAKLVITDRLHGMIYSVITGTPVIAMDNVSGKVGQVYKQWISHIPYVRFVNSSFDIVDAVSDLISNKDFVYENESIRKHYQPIIDFINAEN